MKTGFLAWLRRLPYGGSGRLRGYEQAALDAWRAVLSPEADRRIAAQLDRFVMVQRLSSDKLVTFYAARREGTLPDEILFRYRGDGAVARVRLQAARGEGARQSARCNVDVTVFGGRLAALEFLRPPAELIEGWEVLGVDVQLDPMAERRPEGSSAVPDVAFPPGYFKEIGDRTSSFTRGPWTLFPPGEVWRLSLPDESYVVLAERGGDDVTEGVRLCVRESDDSLVFLDDHGDLLAAAGERFEEALSAGPPQVGEVG
jgi:hypothetical protein